jgi:hypothetical protein
MGQGKKEGYLLIDNRGAGLGMSESATYTCSHCQSIIVKHAERVRERGYCRKCDSYICDACEAERAITGVCRTFKQIVDEYLEVASG